MTQRRVCVATLTYQRPEGLRAIVQALRPHLDDVPGARLLVVDNDVVPSAWQAFRDVADGDPRIGYVHEPRPGIAAARNRALDEAGDADALVFIDDDEIPGEGWLRTLVATWQELRPAAVVGPVISRFPSEPGPWITEGGFFRRLRHPTGDLVTTAATNNLLLDRARVAALGLRFDEEFGLSGGSDTVFTRQLSRSGGRIVWCDEAPVFDLVPPDRLSREWVTRRASRLGNSDVRAAVHLAPPRRRLAVRLVSTLRGGIRVAAGAARLGVGGVTGSVRHQARGSRMMLRGAGMVRGAWGSHLHEYARTVLPAAAPGPSPSGVPLAGTDHGSETAPV